VPGTGYYVVGILNVMHKIKEGMKDGYM